MFPLGKKRDHIVRQSREVILRPWEAKREKKLFRPNFSVKGGGIVAQKNRKSEEARTGE